MDFTQHSIDFNRSVINELDDINRPLLLNFGIFLFTYRRLNKDGTLLHLTTQEDWIEKSIQNNLLVSNEIVPKIVKTMDTSRQNFLWSGNLKDPLYHSLHSSNIWNGITFYQNYDDYIEIIAFASTVDNETASNFYINNLDLLDHFKEYFKTKTKHIIGSEQFKKLSANVEEKIPIFSKHKDPQQKHIDFLNATRLSRYHFSGIHEHIYLTYREAEVLFYLSRGKTSKEIARLLTSNDEKNTSKHSPLSSRTVESHWNQIKLKFKGYNKPQIIDFFLQSNIPNQIAYLNRVHNFYKKL